MPYWSWITDPFPAPLIFRYHLPLMHMQIHSVRTVWKPGSSPGWLTGEEKGGSGAACWRTGWILFSESAMWASASRWYSSPLSSDSLIDSHLSLNTDRWAGTAGDYNRLRSGRLLLRESCPCFLALKPNSWTYKSLSFLSTILSILGLEVSVRIS